MRLTVRLFARLREIAGRDAYPCDLPDGSTVADVWQDAVSRHPALEPYGRSVSSAVNEDFARRTAVVHDGDDVAFLPPVSGGSTRVAR
jgi:molybdopterin converting factor subunit 1